MASAQGSIRGVGAALNRLAECKQCGGSRMVRHTAWRRHGIGKRGVSVGTPTASEELTPEQHCTCVGGTLWAQLCASQFGRDGRLSKVPLDEYDNGRVPIWMEAQDGEPAGWWEIPASNWRQMIIKIWSRIKAGKSLLECCQD